MDTRRKALGHSIYTEADTLDELKEAIRDAVRCHFEDAERISKAELIKQLWADEQASCRGCPRQGDTGRERTLKEEV